MQFRVPQNIAMEDRIVGPLTVIQFTILVIGGFFTFFIYTSSFAPIIRYAGAAFLGMLTLILSMGKFNDQPMYRFFKYVIAFIVRPKTRIWKREGKEPQLISTSHHNADNGPKVVNKKHTRADIARVAATVDSRGESSTPLTPPHNG